MNDFITEGYKKACKINLDMQKISRAVANMAYANEWEECIDLIAGRIPECIAVRDLIDGERAIQVLFIALLHYGNPYIIKSEYEANFGFIDIALAPNLLHYPDMTDAYLIELKYLKKSEEYTKIKEKEFIKKAEEQLAKYAKDKDIQNQWQLQAKGHIRLTKLIVIFHGEEMKYKGMLNFE